jgi:hypothetical protein
MKESIPIHFCDKCRVPINPCDACTDGYNYAIEKIRGGEERNKTAVALLNELSSIEPYGRSVVSDKAYEILERWTQAQSLPQALTTGSSLTVQGWPGLDDL